MALRQVFNKDGKLVGEVPEGLPVMLDERDNIIDHAGNRVKPVDTMVADLDAELAALEARRATLVAQKEVVAEAAKAEEATYQEKASKLRDLGKLPKKQDGKDDLTKDAINAAFAALASEAQ
jgi:hypothetical protein